MKKSLIYTVLGLTTLLALSGCDKDEKKLEIVFDDAVPDCILGEEYDFGSVLIEESGVSYSLQAYYQNYFTMEEFELETNGLKFTQNEQFDVSVIVTAKKGSQTAKRTQLVQCSVAADPIDGLLVSNGFSGFSDTGVTKEITTAEQYLKDGGKTALAVYYQGNNFYRWGATVLSPTNFRCLDYWTDKTWENTILKFWAYNPTEYDIEFQLRVADKTTNLINIDWGNSMNIVQFAKAGEWTEILFPLHRLGVDHTLYINEEGTRDDSLNIKMRWLGAPTEEPTPLYSYQLFIDGLDFVPASEYPDIDTKCYTRAEMPKDSLENMMLDTTAKNGWGAANVKYDREVIRTVENPNSKSSLWATFEDVVTKEIGYSVVYNVGSAVDDGEIEDYPSLTHGVLKADIKFSENISNTDVILIATDSSWSVVRQTFSTTDLGDGWRRVEIDMAPQDAYCRFKEPTRLGFGFPGVSVTNASTAEIHIDNMTYDQDAGSPAKPELETTAEGLENLSIDTGWNGCTYSYDSETINTAANPKSRYSLKLGFNCNTNPNLGYGVTLSPGEDKSITDDKKISAVGNVLEFDLKYSEKITNKKIKLTFVHSVWDEENQKNEWETLTFEVAVDDTMLNNGWYHIVYDMDANTEIATFTEIIRIGVYFSGVSKLNKTTANVWIDNMFVNAKTA